MPPESAIAQSSKKSKRKSVGDDKPTTIEAITSLSTPEPKPSKKWKKNAVTEEAENLVQQSEVHPKTVKKGKKVKIAEETVVASETLGQGSTKSGKKTKTEAVSIVDDISPTVAEGMSKNAKKKLARKAAKEGDMVVEDAVIDTAKGKDKLAKVTTKSAEIATEETEAKPKKVSKPSKDAVNTQSKKSKTQPRDAPPAPDSTINAAEITPAKDIAKQTKKTLKRTTMDSTVSKDSSIPVDPTPSAISSVQPSKKTKKLKAKEPSPEPEPTSLSGDEATQPNTDLDINHEDLHLHGFSTDDDDSSDEDGMDFEPSTFDVGKLPTIAKDDAAVKRKLDKAKRLPTDDRGVIFLGRLPYGFFEDQMKAYFSQFGTVTRIRLSRNKKTGRSKHYGFVEFDSSAVAQIVADTMDNYLIMGHILRCKVIPNNEVHPELWIGANRKWRVVPRDRVTRVEHNKPRTEDEQARAGKRLIKRQNERKRKLADTGIKYDFEAVSYKRGKEVEA